MAEITRLEAQYIDKSKLEILLKDQFGTQYHVKSQDDVIEVTAERKLSDAVVRSIRSQLENSMLRADSGRYFIAESSIQAILTDSVIEKAVYELHCQQQDQIRLADSISAQGIRLFAILIWMKEEDSIALFRRHHVWDQRLPLSKELAQLIVPNFGALLAREEQWRFLPFRFLPNMADHHWEIPQNQILPFVGKSIEVARGTFGDVFKIDISSSQQGFFAGQASTVQIIRKKVRSKDDPGAGKHEMTCLRLLNQLNHPNIIRLLGSYTYNGELNFLFPCFTLALNDFLREDNRFGQFRYGLTFYTAMKGLCSALMNTHSLRLSQSKHGLNFEAIGYHHDIRPANILVSQDTFVLADFGLGNLKDNTVQSQTRWTPTTGDYLAPECMDGSHNPQDVGRAIDVWALACLMTDLITYVHKGPNGVEEFRNKRLSPGRNPNWDDSGFHGVRGELKGGVLDWMGSLPHHDCDGVPFVGLSNLATQTLEKAASERPRIDAVHRQLTYETLNAQFKAIRNLFALRLDDNHSNLSPSAYKFQPLWFTQERFLAWGHALRLDPEDNVDTDFLTLCEVADKATNILMELFQDLKESFENVDPDPAYRTSRSRPSIEIECRIDQRVESLWALLPQNVSKLASAYWHHTILSIDDTDALGDMQQVLESQLSASNTSRALTVMKKIRLAIQTLDPGCLGESTTSWIMDPDEVQVTRKGTAYDIGFFKTSSPVLVEWMWYTLGWEDVSSSQRSLVMGLRAQSFGIIPKPDGLCVMDCLGVFEEKNKNLGYGFVYRIPPGVSPCPTSLHELFDNDNRSSKSQPALGAKFKLALALASFLKQFHTIGWLHENFNSRNILFFRSHDSQNTDNLPSIQELERPFVIGLHKSRPDGSLWQTDGPDSNNSSDYQHPEYARTRRYRIQFDYYSLGTMLLEIAYWRTLQSLLSGPKYQQMGATEIHDDIIKRCKVKLAPKVGKVFTNVVLKCMQGDWEGECGQSGGDLNDFEASSHKTVALGKFIDGVIRPLESLAMVDV